MIATDALLPRINGLVYEKTQHGPAGVELTVRAVSSYAAGGALDFGGSEFRAAELLSLRPEKGPEDKYGWWHLAAGTYRLDFNETVNLQAGERAMLTAHPRLLQAGASHDAVMFGPNEALFVLLEVHQGGLSLKENCRVSRLHVWAMS